MDLLSIIKHHFVCILFTWAASAANMPLTVHPPSSRLRLSGRATLQAGSRRELLALQQPAQLYRSILHPILAPRWLLVLQGTLLNLLARYQPPMTATYKGREMTGKTALSRPLGTASSRAQVHPFIHRCQSHEGKAKKRRDNRRKDRGGGPLTMGADILISLPRPT